MQMPPTLEQALDASPRLTQFRRVFGVTLATDLALANPLLPGAGRPDLTVTVVDRPPFPSDWEQITPAFASPYRSESGESALHLYRLARCDVLHFTGVADFYLWADRIACHILNPELAYLVEIRLLGPVLSLWLERQGVPTLHAAAVTVAGHAIAFLSSNGGGKSALAATLMQAGHPLLSDDILPLERRDAAFYCRPGYPAMRMWPDEAQHFVGRYDTLQLVHPALDKRRVPVGPGGFGSFCDETQALSAIYVPERRALDDHGDTVSIEPISRSAGVVELVRHSFAPRLVEALGLQAQRLDFFARVVQRVPVRRLCYPTGFDHLPRVGAAILADVDQLNLRRSA